MDKTINAQFYCNVLMCLKKKIWQERPDLYCQSNGIVHYENAPIHRAFELYQSFLGDPVHWIWTSPTPLLTDEAKPE